MKKNSTMRIAAVLMVLTLMTSCFVGGTFAKYTTAGESKDSARVAKFGVEVTANFSELFDYEYSTTTSWSGDDDVSVKSVLGGDIIAPGTNGDLADFAVTGVPEVDVNVSYTAEFELGDNWKVDTNDDDIVDAEYCPLVITVNGNGYCIDGTTIKTVAELEAAVENAIVASAKNYNAGTDLSLAENVANDLAVSWTWYFEGSNEGGFGPACQWDKFDTQLGDAFNATISLNIKCTVTQID